MKNATTQVTPLKNAMTQATPFQPDHLKLLSVLAEDEQARRVEAVAEYARLLRRGDPADAGKLRELMRLLGKSAAQAAEDVKILHRYDGKQAIHARGTVEGIEASRVAARKAAEAYLAETARIAEERRKEQERLDGEQSDVEHVYLEGQEAGHAMRDMRRDHPELLGTAA